jgi:cardiolipin synthase
LALAVFILATVSDALDGIIARIYKQQTVAGSYLDPLADKLFLDTCYIFFAVLKLIPSWLAVIVISRDILIVGGNIILYIVTQHLEPRPTVISKINTFFQIITIFIALFFNHFYKIPCWFVYLVWITAFFTSLSGLHYLYRGINLLNRGEVQD